MYQLPHFIEEDPQQVIRFMKQHNFAMVTAMGNPYPVATQLPLEIIEEPGKIILSGHFMRNTAHHKAFEKNADVLVIFYSPHAYIDANWYGNPGQASTVNYITVQATGIMHLLNSKDSVNTLREVTDRHIGKGTAASFENLPADYVNEMAKAIVGFTIEVKELKNVFKLSQNKNPDDYANIIRNLEQRAKPGDLYIAQKMKERL